MSYRQHTCIIPVCDGCKQDVERNDEMLLHYSTEAEAREAVLDRWEEEAKEIDGKLLCAACWTYDDDGEEIARAGEVKYGI